MTSAADRRPEPIDIDDVLDAAADAFINDGFDALTFRRLAGQLGVDPSAIEQHFESIEGLLVHMLNREYSQMYRSIVDDIERDPFGGRLSRIYRYAFSAVYARPLATALYLTDRDGLHRIMRVTHGYGYIPELAVRAEFIEELKACGTVRQDVDSDAVSAVISAVSAGLALLAPSSSFDTVIDGLQQLLERSVDTNEPVTTRGKAAYFKYASGLGFDEV